MPLSEHEQRMLEQMERALYAEDPRLAQTLRESTPKTVNRRQAGMGVVVAALGVATLVAGLIIAQPLVGVLGFIALLGGTYVALRGVAAGERAERAPRDKGGNAYMRGAEDRFRRRREGD